MSPQLRERKKARTREVLIETALDLFEAQGFDATTVDEIAEAALVSRRTFFRYFESKTAVMFPHEAERLALFTELLAREPAGTPPITAVRRALRELARSFVEARDEMLRRQPLIDASPALIAHEHGCDRRWEAALAEAIARLGRRGARGERRARVLAGAVMGAVRATLGEWYASGGRADLVRLGEDSMDLFERGRQWIG